MDEQKLDLAGFRNAVHKSSLFIKRVTDKPTIDVCAFQSYSENFVGENVLHRDYTCRALYCVRDAVNPRLGIILDPSGTGISDTKNRVLRMLVAYRNQDFRERFTESPERFLHAMQLMCEKFTPLKKLKTAMQTWQPGSRLHLHRKGLLAVAARHLDGLNGGRMEYITKLMEFDLHKKLFGLTGVTPEEVFANLEKLIRTELPAPSITQFHFLAAQPVAPTREVKLDNLKLVS